MPEVQFDGANWPGIPSFERCFGTVSQGHEPDVITGSTGIPPLGIVPCGDFSFSDGQRIVTLRDCKLVNVQTSIGDAGYTFLYRFLDRRWRWRFGEISGHYNARDRRDNLIPWMAKTPTEMAEILLEAMGEKEYEIDLPDGVSSTELGNNDNPAPGEKTPETRTNPEMIWDGDNPAVALDRLCQQFNRRLVLDHITNKAYIARPGFGKALPDDGYIETVEESAEAFATPNGVGILGDVIRVQMHLKLIPVGQEWDGRIVPIDELSYRPRRNPAKGKWEISFTVTGAQTGAINMTFGSITVIGGTGVGASATAAALQSAIDSSPDMIGIATVTVTSSGNTVNITVEEATAGQGLEFTASPTVNGAPVSPLMALTVLSNKSAWSNSDPATFYDVTATPRLSYEAARRLALKSVYRWYRQADDDVSAGWSAGTSFKKIDVPYYGKIVRRQQLIWQDSMVEQVIPRDREDDRLAGSGSEFLAENPDTYDGFSRDRTPAIYGKVASACVSDYFPSHYRTNGFNTPSNRRLSVQFAVDTANQIVIFGTPMYVYKTVGRFVSRDAASLVLETSVLIKDEKTNAPLRYRRWVEFAKQEPGEDSDVEPGETTKVDLNDYTLNGEQPEPVKIRNPKDNHGKLGAVPNTIGIEWHAHNDVPYAIIGIYAFRGEAKQSYELIRTQSEEDDVSRPRADYYLGGHLLEHQVKGGQTASYMGIHPIQLDGAIAQVTWEVGDGATTRASRNCEHSLLIPPLNARRRAENLRADEKAATQNIAEGKRYEAFARSIAPVVIEGPLARQQN